MTEYTVVSSWSLEGYFSKESEQVNQKIQEIENLCVELGLDAPILEHNVHSYGEIYKIRGPQIVLEHVTPIWRDDFEI